MILLAEHKDMLLHYIDTFPGKWKQEIRKQWDNPMCVSTLRVLRNQYGPTWLDKLTADKVRSANVRQEVKMEDIKPFVKQVLELINDHHLSGIDQLNLIHRLTVALDFPGVDQAGIAWIEDTIRTTINKHS